jgi:pyridoxine 5-phosphate synthase
MKSKNCSLSVNVNKVATLRNSRGGNVPNLLQCVIDLISFGAEGITVHPRPDERHIKHRDVFDLEKLLKKINRRRPASRKVEFNIEGYPSREFLRLNKKIKPDQATLVPDPPHALTSNAGWAIAKNERQLKKILSFFRKNKIRSSLFVDPFQMTEKEWSALERLKPDRIELYTEKFAKDYVTKNRKSTTAKYSQVAARSSSLGIEVNAGHDLSLENVRYLLKSVPQIKECSIGHALMSESLYFGFKKTIEEYLSQMHRA